jgi:hypothetical protein
MNQNFLKITKTLFFVAIILLIYTFANGCLSQSSENLSSPPNNLSEKHVFNSTHGIYSINATVPVITGKIMTYSVERPNYSEEWISLLAKTLGMSGNIREGEKAFYASRADEENNYFIVYKDKMQISFKNFRGSFSKNLTDSEAIAAVNSFLQRSNITIPDASVPQISGYNTGGEKLPTDQFNQNSKQIVVTSSRRINHIPEWDSKMMITVGDNASVVGFLIIWPDYQPYKKVSIISPEQAFEEFQMKDIYFTGSGLPIQPEKIIVTNVTLGYSAMDGKYLQPVYLFSGYGQQGDSIQEIDPLVKIPASREVFE